MFIEETSKMPSTKCFPTGDIHNPIAITLNILEKA